MPQPPVFSIVTVTLNNLGGLEETAQSLQNQDFTDYEWRVIDGGSTDATVDFLKQTKALWSSAPDRGIYDAMNTGIDRARGAYILFLNAGDSLAATDILTRLSAIIEQENPDFLYGDSLESGHIKPARPHQKIRQNMFTHHQAMLYKRSLIGDLRYDLDYKIAADYDFTARFLRKAQPVSYAPFPVCIFEPGGLSQQNAAQGRREQFEIRKTLHLLPPVFNILLYIAQGGLWRFRTILPGLYWRLKNGRYRSA